MNLLKTLLLALLIAAPCASNLQAAEKEAPATCKYSRTALKLAIGAGLVCYGSYLYKGNDTKAVTALIKDKFFDAACAVVLYDIFKDFFKEEYKSAVDTTISAVHDVLPFHNTDESVLA